ncbi:sugar isomerase [Saccharopolyspora sp. WRP15-2]|uniref:Sugar isomerase n=1 Tax=Saccharopolyspora oryzae TaxID=2997343 RepID=A0ABT4VBA3_9PSEU|nr:sugar isomerase [Saccharopolyspora oryzae]MDA3631237.1 sugar isomerase [Saccharopolyspora oryzae]
MGKRRLTGLTGIALAALLALSAAPGGASPAAEPWSGGFADFPGDSWKQQWGVVDEGTFGYDRMTPQDDALDVFYGKGSSAPSCGDCPSEGGGQFYTDFRSIGRDDLADAPVLHLSYQVRFPADWDFGRRGGKLPGLYGGPPGQASGGEHGKAWSTRYMWRIRSDEPKATVYVYDPSMGDGYGEDVGLGAWNWQADDQWHTVEQSVDRTSGTITVWYDGQQVLSEQGIREIADIPFSGVFFSTFFGGHDTSWGPSRDVHAQFRDFRVSDTGSS